MKKALFLLGLALLGLTACSPQVSQPTPPPSTAAQAPAPSFSPTPTTSPSPTFEAEELHLPFYDQFDRYNNGVDEHDFLLYEVDDGGELRYCFQNEEHGVLLYVTPGGKTEPLQAVLYGKGQDDPSLEFEMPIFVLGSGTVSGTASLHLADLTGDGVPELIYIFGSGGTGVWQDHVKVFDLSSMTECPVTWDNENLEQAVQLNPAELRKGDNNYQTAVFEITGPDGQTVYGSTGYGGDALPEHLSAVFGFYERIALTEGRLTLTSSFAPDLDIPSLHHLGNLSRDFVYDPISAAFSLQSPYGMEVYDPAEF